VRFRLRPPFIRVEKIKQENFNIVRWERDDFK